MTLFTLEKYEVMGAALEQGLPWLKSGRLRVGRYENNELHATVLTPVPAEHCLVLGSIAPPDEQLMAVGLLAHTLKKERASKVTALLPYLAYSRQEKDKPRESLATAWVGVLLKASGCDQVITVDLHSEADKSLFPIGLISLSSADLFARAINEYQLREATMVAPDNGAIPRCEAVKTAAGMRSSEIPYFEKHRLATGITHVGPMGKVGRRVVMIDDILDTGMTLLSACQKLVAMGVEEIHIMVTHGLFTGNRWRELWDRGVKRIFCTDTVPLPAVLDSKNILRLSSVPLLQSQISSLENRPPEAGVARSSAA